MVFYYIFLVASALATSLFAIVIHDMFVAFARSMLKRNQGVLLFILSIIFLVLTIATFVLSFMYSVGNELFIWVTVGIVIAEAILFLWHFVTSVSFLSTSAVLFFYSLFHLYSLFSNFRLKSDRSTAVPFPFLSSPYFSYTISGLIGLFALAAVCFVTFFRGGTMVEGAEIRRDGTLQTRPYSFLRLCAYWLLFPLFCTILVVNSTPSFNDSLASMQSGLRGMSWWSKQDNALIMSESLHVTCHFFRVDRNRSTELFYLNTTKPLLRWCFDVFLRPYGYKKLPMNAPSPAFFSEEVASQKDAHLCVGLEIRNDQNNLTTRWTASAVEIEDDDESHLELVLKSHHPTINRSALVLLLELGQLLECEASHILLGQFKSSKREEQFIQSVSQFGFEKPETAPSAASNASCVTYRYPDQIASFGPKRETMAEAF
ncbi:hypothetical protein BLNAU_16036 [Blattamonas nauphoetae]|uniref:Uncharacterized protein n=1 Tax=Blattamonas nauphoetae TaxID=2049346 RepID=A0ABQ9XAS4_9EUKA|nr:hypothetical protein BLNAU_16036 [Blattamonas nauphoetae]